jgi:hypothetical protein
MSRSGFDMGIRILNTGDFQLEKAFGTLGNHAQTFREQLMKTFANVIQNHGPEHDLILIAGDLFDRKATPTSIIEEAATILATCTTPCLIIPGNHDPVNSGIPAVLQEALSQRGAANVQVAVTREPVVYADLGITLYPAPLFRKDDISDQWGWIPERTKKQGVRIALMHGALTSLPGGLIPEDLAQQKDLDLVICGDQHGPGEGDASSSNLFNLEVSKQRKLYYAMAPEAQHINQNFTGAYLSLEMKSNGDVVSAERIEVGEIRFVNEIIEFQSDTEDIGGVLASRLEHIQGRPPELSSIRLTLQGNMEGELVQQLISELGTLKSLWPILEIVNEVSEVEGSDVVNDDHPVLNKLRQALNEDRTLTPRMKKSAFELLKLNIGRWQ